MRSGRLLFATIWLFLSLAAVSTAAAQNPFVGTWKLNQEKSQLAGDTMKFGPAASEAIELTAGGTTYSFRVDGKPYALPSGDVAIWRQDSPGSWTTEYRKIDDKLLSSDNWKLSSDEKTLTVTTSGVKANGDLYTNTAEYVRTAGTSGLIGTWKSTAVKLSSPNELTIQEAGLDGLILKIAALKATAATNFDGKEVAVEGPDIPTGLRLSLTRTGPYKFRIVEKLNGNVVDSSEYTVSPDGQTMIAVGGAPGDPPATVVWEKQAAAPSAGPADHPPASPVIPTPGVH
jgi:uncharacterized cupin superfamily protein